MLDGPHLLMAVVYTQGMPWQLYAVASCHAVQPKGQLLADLILGLLGAGPHLGLKLGYATCRAAQRRNMMLVRGHACCDKPATPQPA